MLDETTDYLIWSHEHGAWWGPGLTGYVKSLFAAGRYTRADALRICTKAIPGTADRTGVLPELPVRLADVLLMRDRHIQATTSRDRESWE